MVCPFCYDRPIVMATGKNGKLNEVRCPVCGLSGAPGFGVDIDNARARRKSRAMPSNDNELPPEKGTNIK
jgi:hypothetical protein